MAESLFRGRSLPDGAKLEIKTSEQVWDTACTDYQALEVCKGFNADQLAAMGPGFLGEVIAALELACNSSVYHYAKLGAYGPHSGGEEVEEVYRVLLPLQQRVRGAV